MVAIAISNLIKVEAQIKPTFQVGLNCDNWTAKSCIVILFTHSFCKFASDVNTPAVRDVIAFEDKYL